MESKVMNKKWDDSYFDQEREKTLAIWPTGKEVDLDEAVEFHKSLPKHKNMAWVIQNLRDEGKIIVFPRAGTPILEQEIELNKTLVESGLRIIPVTPDSFCRLARYDKAQAGLEASIKTGEAKLNGYPTVVHGVKNTRKVVEATDAALNQRLTNVGGVRLMAEIAFAAGMTGALVDPLITFGWYEKKTTAAQCFQEYQYIYRLIGRYAERGAIIAADLDGIGTNLQFPITASIVSNIVCALLAAEQGVMAIVPWCYVYGNIAQDVAGVNLMEKLVNEYLIRYGYTDAKVPGLFPSQIPLFPYPRDMGEAFGFLCYSAMVAALCKGECTFLRHIDEAFGIASRDAHAISYRAVKWIFDVVREQGIIYDNEDVRTEERIIELEVRAIMDRIFELGEGDVAVGFDRAVQTGEYDLPLCGNLNVKNQVLGIRDLRGACRYLDFGNLPLPNEVKEFHRAKIREREIAEGRKMDTSVVVQDFWTFSKGRIRGGAWLPPQKSKLIAAR
jgi:methylaspartate mutase epsilon subunit